MTLEEAERALTLEADLMVGPRLLVGIDGLRNLIEENQRLRAKVTELQAAGTVLVERLRGTTR